MGHLARRPSPIVRNGLNMKLQYASDNRFLAYSGHQSYNGGVSRLGQLFRLLHGDPCKIRPGVARALAVPAPGFYPTCS